MHPDVHVNVGIEYSTTFAQLDACVAADLDTHEWFYGVQYSNEFKALIMAWHSAVGEIALHVEDAKYRKSQRKR